MKHIIINLNKDEVLQLKRGGKIDFYFNGTEVRVEIKGPKKEDKWTNTE
mgnify:CR=1 FL=1